MTAAYLLLLIIFAPDRTIETRVVTVADEATCQMGGKLFMQGEPFAEKHHEEPMMMSRPATAYGRAFGCIQVQAPGVGV